jgi:hypothetical protein
MYCVYVCRIMDGGCSKSAPFQPRHPNEHWIISWCVEMLAYYWHKGPRGYRIDWLVWRLTTTIARHYMHTLEMKKKKFHKNKVMEAIITWSVENASLIPFTHMYQPTLESDEAWGVRSQHLPNVIYMVKFPFIEMFCCTCEWALRKNMCKHQIMVILTCTNISQEDIIH